MDASSSTMCWNCSVLSGLVRLGSGVGMCGSVPRSYRIVSLINVVLRHSLGKQSQVMAWSGQVTRSDGVVLSGQLCCGAVESGVGLVQYREVKRGIVVVPYSSGTTWLRIVSRRRGIEEKVPSRL